MRRYFWEGVVESVPLAISLGCYSLVFGMLARQSGLIVKEIFFMSAFVFAGASQFAILPLIQNDASLFTMISTTYVINLRHYLMAASLSTMWPNLKKYKKAFLAFFLIDENFALASRDNRIRKGMIYYYAGSGIMLYAFWVLPSTLGAWIGNFICQPEKWGLDFAFPAAFLGLLIPLIKRKTDFIVAVIACILSVFGALLLPGSWYILIAGIGASFIGFLLADLRRLIR